ncbi:MAG: von Willebrand factor type A domain-containing protein [Bacteroidota bacterium]
MQKTSLLLSIFFLSVKLLFAEINGIEVTGTVYDAVDGSPVPGVNVLEKGTTNGAVSDINGAYKIFVKNESAILVFSFIGYTTAEIVINSNRVINVNLQVDNSSLSEVIVTGVGRGLFRRRSKGALSYGVSVNDSYNFQPRFNTEGYTAIDENEFLKVTKNPLSTFSIDVDAASYSNIRRFINIGQRPPKDAVRIEEMINYFNYSYPLPEKEDPFSIYTELATCPWNEDHNLVHIGLQGKEIPTENLPTSNFVFLIDVSGSMNSPNKLPLLKSAFNMLVENLRNEDRVAIVVYAGAAGLVLPSTPGNNKAKIKNSINRLTAGGSTAGGEGIELAYHIASENFIEGGNNRIILATDGDFNTGPSSNAHMESLIEKKREERVFLTVLGFGMGNYKDDKMEILADKGNGNYAYIDNLQEARKVLINEFGGTMFTIAKDVKLQIEFNPVKVQAYRLIGYENRLLEDEDFNDDKKDAGELGSGHTVTALYEIIPAGVKSRFIKSVDSLKYQRSLVKEESYNTNEVMTIKFRYKAPDDRKSQLITNYISDNTIDWRNASINFKWSAAVAEFGMLLRDSKYSQSTDIASVTQLAKDARGEDDEGYRREFIRLVESSKFLSDEK